MGLATSFRLLDKICKSFLLLSTALCLQANPFEERFGLGARMKAMGNVGIAQAEDFSAVYYNPANLGFCPKSLISLAFQNTGTFLKAQREKPDQLGSNNMLHVGLCLKLPFNLSLGAYGGFSPLKPVTMRFRTLDNKPRFPFYDHSLTPPSMGLGLSIRPISWFSLGLSTSVTVHTEFMQKIDIPMAPKRLEIDINGVVRPTLPLVAGLSIEPLNGLRIGAVYRSPRYNKLEDISNTHIDVGLTNFDAKQNIEGSFGFSPLQLGLGASYSFYNFIISSELTWYQWEEYLGPFLHVSSDNSSELSNFVSYPALENFNFKNIFIPRFGVEYNFKNMISARAGYGFRTSAAPTRPSGVAKLLDAHAHMLSCGGAYKYQWEKVALNADVFFSAHILHKSGWAYDTGLSLGLEY